jgi:DNA adenine methylase
MTQKTLFDLGIDEVVNVAKVPQRSPFRYPGGKTWLVPRIRRWMDSLARKPALFIEPFAGGGIIGLTIAFEDYADQVILVEIDKQVAAVWKTILGTSNQWLADRIVSFNLSHESARQILASNPQSLREMAFQTILKNRIYHGGILANGSGMIKNGENGKGLHSRWYPNTLRKRILDIARISHKISFFESDGMQIIVDHKNDIHAVFFIDPPYTAGGKKAGKRLYNYNDVDHERLFELASNIKGECILTYDDADEVRGLAAKYGFDYRLVGMKNAHNNKMKELIIGKNLHWFA